MLLTFGFTPTLLPPEHAHTHMVVVTSQDHRSLTLLTADTTHCSHYHPHLSTLLSQVKVNVDLL